MRTQRVQEYGRLSAHGNTLFDSRHCVGRFQVILRRNLGDLGHNKSMRQISVHEAKAHFSSIMKEVEAGEVVVVTRHDKPVIEMRAVSDLRTPQLGAFAEKDGVHLEVSWTDEELEETFGELGVMPKL